MDLWACGSNSDGQLGVGHTHDTRVWARCIEDGQSFPPRPWTVVQIASTAVATLALCEHEGATQLWTCGRAWPGRESSAFISVDGLNELGIQGNIVHIAAVWDCFYVVERVSDGDRMWAIGSSHAFGQWGTGPLSAPPQELATWLHRVPLLERVPNAATNGPWRVEAVSGGVRHILAVLTSPDTHWLVGWGQARHGQLGPVDARIVYAPEPLLRLWTAQSPTAPPIYALSLGMAHSVVTAQHDKTTCVWRWGSNRHGQLHVEGWDLASQDDCANPTTVPYAVAAACMWRTTLWHIEGRVLAHGASSHAQTCAHGWTCDGTLSAGSEHALLLDSQGAVHGWGWNEHGNLAHPDESVAPRQVWDGPAVARIWTGYGTSWVGVRVAH